jgi:PKD repeat protein
MKSISALTLTLVALSLFFSSAAASIVSIENVQVNSVGETASTNLTLDSVPAGLAGYNISVSIADPSIATITGLTFPQWAILNKTRTFPSSLATFAAVDLTDQIQPQSTQVPLGNLTFQGLKKGSTAVQIIVNRMDDDSGNPVSPSVRSGTFVVNSLQLLGNISVTSSPPGATIALDGNNQGHVTPYILAGVTTGQHWINLSISGYRNASQQVQVTGSETVTVDLALNPSHVPGANFTGAPLSGITPLTVVFNDTSSNTPTSWVWDFGDGNSTNATVQNPVHTYYSAGIYTVNMTAKNPDGSNSLTRINYITAKISSRSLKSKAGVFQNGVWSLDYNGNISWDGSVIDRQYSWGWSAATPVVGDWNGDGKTEIGVYYSGLWWLDYNGNGVWDGPTVDKYYTFGSAESMPEVGDWNGDGKTEIGTYNAGTWQLDYNGNGVWDSTTDKQYTWGWSASTPVVGDWNGDGTMKIGVYYNGWWWLDYNGNGVWDGTTDKQYTWGWSASTPVVGDWNADGKTKIAVYYSGQWWLDTNGNGTWDGLTVDRSGAFRNTGGIPLVGKWI